ncbi:hypothetical protein FDECE_13083, partial [Fusarium decemcellulare]
MELDSSTSRWSRNYSPKATRGARMGITRETGPNVTTRTLEKQLRFRLRLRLRLRRGVQIARGSAGKLTHHCTQAQAGFDNEVEIDNGEKLCNDKKRELEIMTARWRRKRRERGMVKTRRWEDEKGKKEAGVGAALSE